MYYTEQTPGKDKIAREKGAYSEYVCISKKSRIEIIIQFSNIYKVILFNRI